ncbi:GMC family oxidoreductase [Pseudomonas vanderleydeniana]|uniref:GMC family oxidoreductase n=1 Tax=Pseudomonas vanderleydeniana TaxID=2745495 RepID=A0A9E6PRG9_9PSED|nr:GMC family oxidoreductase [Pseudomonas vanderleydeniana]QXI30895.1 GMC family oxidoreductase [Pseudomonas vanderleydeniana]
MAIQRKKADVVIVGLGWAGSLMAEELTRAGLEVVAIDRGPWLDTSTDTPPAVDPDELRWTLRRELLLQPSDYTLTFRNHAGQTAIPTRELKAFQMGKSVGGAGFHWAGMAWRFSEWDFKVRSATLERYGASKLKGLDHVQDWGITYQELEPFYDRFERIAGISGVAGNLNGERRPGGNPFEGPRSREYPTPALKDSRLMQMYRETTAGMGLNPFYIPVAHVGAAYVNPLGVSMAPCTYCGYCMFHGCGNYSKSSPQACIIPALMRRKNFTLITQGYVYQVHKAEDGKTATGVSYYDEKGQQVYQPADIVCLASFTYDNARLMMLSGIGEQYDPATGKGTLGRNYNYQTCSGAHIWFEGETLNPFIGAGGLGIQVDDYNGDNFDHSALDFIGGAGLLTVSREGMPIGRAGLLPPGSPRWGKDFKRTYQKNYQNYAIIFGQGTSMPDRGSYLSLDPNYKDRYGVPLLSMTFDFNQNDRNMARFIEQRAVEIGQQLGAKHHLTFNSAAKTWNPYDEYSNHTQGGMVMGEDRRTSAVNTYLQSWDAHNVFVVGASAFPTNAGYNPTGTVGALAIRTARAIHEKYQHNPGPLV